MAGLSECSLSSEGDELPRCSTLFLTEDGSQMAFYMTPCAMKTRLRPLIHHGGGHLSSKVLTDSIKLATSGTGKNLPCYISSDYIFDSIKHNKLQDLEKYSMKSLDASAHVKSSKINRKSTSSNIITSSSSMKSLDASAHVKSSKIKRKSTSSNIITSSSSTKRGRHKYTIDEDLALMKFVKEHFNCCPIKGNILYKKAEKAKITSHPWQSMRDHYLKVLHKQCKNKEYRYTDLFKRTRTLKGSVDEGRVTRAQATKRQEKVDCQNKSDTEIDQGRVTRSQTSKVKEKCEKSSESDNGDDIDDTSEDTDQEWIPFGKTPTVTAKIDDKDKHVATDDTSNTLNTDCFPDEAMSDNADDEKSAAEEVDYDKIFDDNLLKQAYEYKKGDSSEVENDATEDEDADEESRVSSSQEMVSGRMTRSSQKTMSEQERLSDFDGEIVFRKNLQSPSAKKAHSEDEEDNKTPMAKRSKNDLESLSDDENNSKKQAFLKYFQALQRCLQKLHPELTVPQIIHALLVSSGYLDDADDYYQNGSGKQQWTSKEDKILLSKNKDDISSLTKKRGLHAVIDRMNFMEGTN